MSEIQDSVLKANRVARIESLLQVLHARPQELGAEDRSWVVELLYPFAQHSSPDQRLIPAEERATQHHDLLLEALLEEYARPSVDRAALEAEVEGIIKLLTTLADPQLPPLDEDSRTRLTSIATRLRSHLLRSETIPTRPTISF